VLVTVKPLSGGQFELWLVNDSPQEIDDVIALRIQRFNGTVLSEQRFPMRVEPNSPATLVRRFGWGRVVQPRSTYVTAYSERGAFAPTRQVFADPLRLELPPVELTLEARALDRTTVDVTLEADAFALAAALEHPLPGLVYDDNSVSLDPRQPRTIRVTHPHDAVDPALFEARVVYGKSQTCAAQRLHVGGLTRS
jgi:hypothetical protein